MRHVSMPGSATPITLQCSVVREPSAVVDADDSVAGRGVLVGRIALSSFVGELNVGIRILSFRMREFV
jgi:hypothetical protein